MSIEATTQEEIVIKNANESTSAFARKIRDYLLETWGIDYIEIEADGETYSSDEEKVEDDEDLYEACKDLDSYKEISISLLSTNGGGLTWRRELFIDSLNDADDLKGYVTYKSVDYYDVDSKVDLCLFNNDGLQYPVAREQDDIDKINDVEEWFAYSPVIKVCSQSEDEELHDLIIGSLTGLIEDYTDADEEDIYDEWEDDGTVTFSESVYLGGSDVGQFYKKLKELERTVSSYPDTNLELDLNFVPNGAEDYPFSVLSFRNNSDGVKLLLESI